MVLDLGEPAAVIGKWEPSVGKKECSDLVMSAPLLII